MIKLYHTDCPQCKMVELRLKKKNIEYEEIRGEDKIRELGFNSSPVIEASGKYYVGGKECLEFLKSIGA